MYEQSNGLGELTGDPPQRRRRAKTLTPHWCRLWGGRRPPRATTRDVMLLLPPGPSSASRDVRAAAVAQAAGDGWPLAVPARALNRYRRFWPEPQAPVSRPRPNMGALS